LFLDPVNDKRLTLYLQKLETYPDLAAIVLQQQAKHCHEVMQGLEEKHTKHDALMNVPSLAWIFVPLAGAVGVVCGVLLKKAL
jgi:hypothetical protein